MNSSNKLWALVTGASMGIGRAIAIEFAARGYSIVAVSRDQDALESLAKECRERYQVEVDPIVLDLAETSAGENLIKRIRSKGHEIDVLVNNAGFGVHGEFLSTDLSKELEMVHIQADLTIELTKTFLPEMVKRRRGGILNVGSVYSFSPVPYQAIYGATKAFLLSFAEAIRSEITGSGVTISSLCPGITQTEFRKRAGMRDRKKMAGWTAEAVAKYGVNAFFRGKAIAVPRWQNKLFVILARHLPQTTVPWAVRAVNRVRGVAPK